MPPWILKAAVQGITSMVPGAERVNRMFQRARGSLRLDETTLADKYRACRRHLANYANHAVRLNPTPAVVELGTGWFPIVPVGFALCGAEPVYTVDIVSHLERDNVIATLREFVACARKLEGIVPARLERVERVLAEHTGDARELLAAVGVTVVVGDATKLDLGRSVDLIASANTLEHIPHDVLRALFRQFRSLLDPAGIMSHWIDMTDHYMNFDPTIGPYNFLKFPSQVWRLFNNRHQYQNRLRVSDFRTLHADTGWKIVDEDNRAGTIEELRRVKVAPEFRRYSEAELLVYETWMTARRT